MRVAVETEGRPYSDSEPPPTRRGDPLFELPARTLRRGATATPKDAGLAR